MPAVAIYKEVDYVPMRVAAYWLGLMPSTLKQYMCNGGVYKEKIRTQGTGYVMKLNREDIFKILDSAIVHTAACKYEGDLCKDSLYGINKTSRCLRTTPAVLKSLRDHNDGPPYVRLGTKIRYPWSGIQAYKMIVDGGDPQSVWEVSGIKKTAQIVSDGDFAEEMAKPEPLVKKAAPKKKETPKVSTKPKKDGEIPPKTKKASGKKTTEIPYRIGYINIGSMLNKIKALNSLKGVPIDNWFPKVVNRCLEGELGKYISMEIAELMVLDPAIR